MHSLRSALLAAALAAAACAHGSLRGSASDVHVADASAATWIEPGITYAGTTSAPDPDIRGLLAPARFRFHGEGGARVRFRLHSKTDGVFGRSLALHASDGARIGVENAAQNDGSTLSTALLPAAGEYLVEFSTGSTSAYQNDFRIEFLPSSAPPVTELAQDVPYRGELTSRDRRDFDDRPSDLLRFHVGDDHRKLRFVVVAPGFEPQLEVYEDLTRTPEQATGGELTATLSPPTGDVYVRVGSSSGQRGSYELVVQDARAYEMERMPVLEVGTTITVPLVPDWRFAEFKIRGEVGVPYMIQAESADFDVELILHNNMPPSRLAGMADDNGAGGTDALLVFKFPDTEEWVVRVAEKAGSTTAAGEFALGFYAVDDPYAYLDQTSPEVGAEGVTHDAVDAFETIRRHLAESSATTWTIELEPDGRLIRRDSADNYEEHFFLRDVTEVAYDYVADWTRPHAVRVKLTETAETKYRYGDGNWSSSTDKQVSFAFTNKVAADAVVAALRQLVASR